jgi:pyruvate dehydrogenase E2 component (dihydrolipoamide acetyltransferase)
MAIEVVLPKVDMDMESGVIAVWKVAEGDFVKQGDILFEMETDKSVMEVDSPGTGTIRGLAAITGEPVAVGTAVAWIDSAVQEAADGGVRSTSLARRSARPQGADVAGVAGTGPRGRIGASNVDTHAAVNVVDRTRAEPGRRVAQSSIRRIAAKRLSESMRTAPHFYLTAQVEMTALREARQDCASGIVAAIGIKPGITLLLARLVGRVLVDHPLINASIDDDAVVLHEGAHIGIAMDRDGDLVVPVLRDVDSRTLIELTHEYKRLRDALRSRTIAPSDMRGGTFTISNLGMYGVDAFTAIINQPQSAILAIGRTVDTPVGRKGEIVLRPIATLSLSSDHRIVDGVTAARFMSDVRRAIEHPAALL